MSEIFWPEGGGAEYATYLNLKLLRYFNYNITIVSGTKSPRTIQGIRYYYTPLLRNLNRISRWTYIKMLSRQYWFSKQLDQHDTLYIPLAAYPLIPIAKKKGMHVIVHLHNYIPVRYYGVKYFFENDTINRYRELKFSIMHEVYVNRSIKRAILMPPSFTLYTLSKYWIKLADSIICVSKRHAEIIAKRLSNKKINVIYNPLPEWAWYLNRFMKPQEKSRNTLLYTGGISSLKGFEIILCLGLNLFKRYKNIKLIMTKIIKPKNKLFMNLLVKYYKKPFIYLNRINYDQLLMLYKRSIVLLHPSIWEEPLPYSIVESILLGTLVVATLVGGLPEILGKTCNILCVDLKQCKNLDDLISSLIYKISFIMGLSNDEYIDMLSSAKENILKKMSPYEVANKLISVFDYS